MAALALAVPAPSLSAEASSPTLSLPALLAEARTRNPELLAARERSAALAAVPPQARALEDPTVTWEAWNAPNSFRLDHADNNIIRVSQRIPFPGKRALAGEVAAYGSAEASHGADAVELDVLAAVKRAYVDLWLAYERHAVSTREQTLLDRMTHVVESRYATSDATQADVLRSQVELTHVVTRLATETIAIERARLALAALLSKAPDEVAGRPEPLAPPRLAQNTADVVAQAFAHRPELRGADAAIAREQAAVRLAERNRYPDFEVSLGRFINDDAADGFGAMLSMNVPIFNGGKYAAAIDEARARLRAAEAERRRVVDGIRREVADAYLRADTARVEYELFTKTHVPHTEQALRVTESAYEAGQVPFLDLLDTLRSIENVHLDHVNAEAAFETAYADLERAAGTALPRSGGDAGPAGHAHE